MIGTFMGLLVMLTTGWKIREYYQPRPTVEVAPPVEKKIMVVDAESDTALELADTLVDYALTLMGTPYVYGGKQPDGFDCSGFLYYVYGQFGIDMPASSSYFDTLGQKVPIGKARKGDVLVFTGTNHRNRTPGHVGMVITDMGADSIKFVHSSSASCMSVTISSLREPSYERRFLQVRRVIK